MPTRSNTATLSDPEPSRGTRDTIRVLLVHQSDLVRRELRRVLADDPAVRIVGQDGTSPRRLRWPDPARRRC